jgi:hypothetical protein
MIISYPAQEMKLRADEVNSKSNKFVLKQIYERIFSAANFGLYSIIVNFLLSDSQRIDLQNKGYTLTSSDGSSGTIISWNNGN